MTKNAPFQVCLVADQEKPFLETCILLSMPGETKCRTSLNIRKLKNASDKFKGKTTLSPKTAA